MDFGTSDKGSPFQGIYNFEGSPHWLVEGVTFRDSSSGFLTIYERTNVTVRNNVIMNIRGDGIFSGWTTNNGLYRDVSNPCVVTNNTIFNNAGVHFYLSQLCDYFYNDAYRSHLLSADVGNYYCVNQNGNGTQVAYNWGHDCVAPHFNQYVGCMPFYLDLSCSDFKFHHNVAWNSSNPSAFFMYTTNQKPAMSNNVFAYNTGFGVKYWGNSWPANAGSLLNNTVINNIFTNGTGQGNTVPGISVLDNYLTYHPFKKPQSPFFDFTLQDGSPAKNAVKTRLGAPFDHKIPANKIPDQGAYDSSQPVWIPGARINQKAFRRLVVTCQSSSSTSECKITNIPVGFRLAQDFQIKIGNSNPVTCVSQYSYETHIATGICSAVPLPTTNDDLSIYIRRIGSEAFVDSRYKAAGRASTTGPTRVPTATPTKAPTATPSKVPTAAPTRVPTATPTTGNAIDGQVF